MACLAGQEIFGKLGDDRFYLFLIALYSADSGYDFGRTVFHPQTAGHSGKTAPAVGNCLTDFSVVSIDRRAVICLKP